MSPVVVEILLIVGLLVVNGVFAMSEIAVVSSRKARLQERADRGHTGARRALALAEEPNRFLATVQVGITAVGILAGAFGGATVAEKLAVQIATIPSLAAYANGIALGIVVLCITYLSLIIGELVPKRIGLNAPETIASFVAGPMGMLSRAAAPLVWVLTGSTEFVLRLLRVRKSDEPPVTEAEIAALLEVGAEAGVFDEREQALVQSVFWLADQRVATLMIPRVDIAWVDVNDPFEVIREEMLRHSYSRFVVADGALDRVLGIVDVRALWEAQLRGQTPDLRELPRPPMFVPESAKALTVLNDLRSSGGEVALVADEYGGISGLVTLHDLMEQIVGDIQPLDDPAQEPEAMQRDDGSWLVDGSMGIDDLRELLSLNERRGGDRHAYHTVGGLIFTHLGRVPGAGDHVDWEGHRLEVMDMDGRRVDKVLIVPPAGGSEEPDAEPIGGED